MSETPVNPDESADIFRQVENIEENISSQDSVDIHLPQYVYGEEHSLNEAQYQNQMELNKDIVHYREMRKDFAYKVYFFLVIWSVCLLGLLIAKGAWDKFNLSDTIMITLCGGTTISSIGLVGFVVKGLFDNHSK